MSVGTGGAERTAEPHETYDPAFFEKLVAVEDRHFWFRRRNDVIAAVVGRFTAAFAPGFRVVEVGCGTGNTLRVLEQICPTAQVIGVDPFEEGLRHARRRVSCELIQGTVEELPEEPPFHLICLFDVLEHLPEDEWVLAHLFSRLAAGGKLVLTVPAHMSLWSDYDELGHHCRRYGCSELGVKLRAAGFRIEYLSEFMTWLFPLVWLRRRAAAALRRPRSSAPDGGVSLIENEMRIVPVLNGLLYWLLAVEVPLVARGWRLPIGTSIIAVAERPAAVEGRGPGSSSAQPG